MPHRELKVLFVTPYCPTRIRTRSYHLLRALAAEGHRVSLASLWTSECERCVAESLREELELLILERMDPARSLWNCLRTLPSRQPLQAAFSWNQRLASRVASEIDKTEFDVIHVEHLRGSRYALRLRAVLAGRTHRRPALVWDSVDCISSLFRQGADEAWNTRSRWLLRFELSRTEAFEGGLIALFDRVLVTSEQDRRDLLALESCGNGDKTACAERIKVVTNGVDLEYFSPTENKRDSRAIVISGKMSYHANVTAVLSFVADVMPKVWRDLPDVCLWVVGKDPAPELRRLESPRVRVTGTVEDIRPYLRQAAVAVAPIRYGAGVQNKVLESLACGTPVIATPQAVGSLGVRWGQHLMVASEPREFAETIILLLGNDRLRAGLSEAGRLFVERQHDWRSVARGLAEIYRGAQESVGKL